MLKGIFRSTSAYRRAQNYRCQKPQKPRFDFMVFLIMLHHKGQTSSWKRLVYSRQVHFCSFVCIWPVQGPEKPALSIWSHTGSDNVALGATKADESLHIKSGHTKNNNGMHKQRLGLWKALRGVRWVGSLWRGEKRPNEQEAWLEPLTGAIQRQYCGPATDPVGPALGGVMRNSPL